MVTAKRKLLRQQRRWAKSIGLEPDERGYLKSIEMNLLRPLSPSTLEDFQRDGGAELNEAPKRPAKMRALHSSAVLVVNVFDFWAGQDAAALLGALDIEGSLRAPVSFETQFSTGLTGSPPIVDVALELESGSVVGIESKFTEWLTPKRRNAAAFKEKYFESGSQRWAAKGLPSCQGLAGDLMHGSEQFRFLNAAQLLKHALGLATQRGDQFALHYLYYDVACAPSEVHREEVERFAGRVGSELRFRAGTYQQMYGNLASRDDVDSHYTGYLGRRYFSEPA